MDKIFLQEGLLYTKPDLLKCCGYNNDSEADQKAFSRMLSELKRKRLIKSRRKKGSRESSADDASLISEDDSEFYEFIGTEKEGIQYLFRFVGIFFFDDRVIYVYPKYIKSSDSLDEKMKQIINVIRKHQGKVYQLDVPQILEEVDKGEEITELSIILFLLSDYSENGLYYESEKITELNGEGEIHWGKTVEKINPYIKNNRPVYYDVITSRRKDNNFNFFVRLHKCILTESSKQVEKTGIVDLFSLPQIDLSDEELDSFGDNDYLMDSLEIEMGQQYDDRKLAVLHAMFLYIKQKASQERAFIKSNEPGLSFFGTRSFHRVWEDVVDCVYVSHKQMTFGKIQERYDNNLDFLIPLHNGSTAVLQRTDVLEKCIEKPEWYRKDESSMTHQMYLPSSTFIPDYLRFSENNDTFYILDAKYYMPEWHVNGHWIERQPGVEDVAKQYLYYFAFKELLDKNKIGINHVENYFIMPTEENDKDAGFVRIAFFERLFPGIFNIRIKLLNAYNLFDLYLHDKELNVSSIP